MNKIRYQMVITILIMIAMLLFLIPFIINVYNNYEVSNYKKNIFYYGVQLELAISDYKNINGTIPNDISILDVDVDNIKCGDTVINNNGSVYLSKCRVNGIYVKDDKQVDGYYHYGDILEYDYLVGDIINYAGRKWYVISTSDSYITVMLDTLISTEELLSLNTKIDIYDNNGDGLVAYYSDNLCNDQNISNCDNRYESSNIRVLLNKYLEKYLNQDDLAIDDMGYKIRLVGKTELLILGYSDKYNNNIDFFKTINADKKYWTMTKVGDNDNEVYTIGNYETKVYAQNVAGIRPVINLKKEKD